MEDLIPINIIIADRSYRIKTKSEDEEQVRKILKTINDKIIEFKTMYAGKDMQDYVSMVIIWYTTQAASESDRPQSDNEISESLRRMEEMIDKV